MPSDAPSVSSITIDDHKSENGPEKDNDVVEQSSEKEQPKEQPNPEIDESRYLTGVKLFLVFL